MEHDDCVSVCCVRVCLWLLCVVSVGDAYRSDGRRLPGAVGVSEKGGQEVLQRRRHAGGEVCGGPQVSKRTHCLQPATLSHKDDVLFAFVNKALFKNARVSTSSALCRPLDTWRCKCSATSTGTWCTCSRGTAASRGDTRRSSRRHRG